MPNCGGGQVSLDLTNDLGNVQHQAGVLDEVLDAHEEGDSLATV